MKARDITLILVVVVVVLAAFAIKSPIPALAHGVNADALAAPLAAPIGTAFTYQGQLMDGGAPADGLYDLRFRLYDSQVGGSQSGSTVFKNSTLVSGGLFSVQLDFGASAFAGGARWLEIGVGPGGSGTYTVLSGRQEVTPTPYALYAADAPTVVENGDIYINAGLDGWGVNGAGSNYIYYYTSYIQLRAPGAGTYGYQITPDLPATLYGRQLYTHSVKLCYDATYGASITGVFFEHFIWDGPGWVMYRIVQDTTTRADATCREYVFAPSDGSLWGSDHVALYITVAFTGAGDHVRIGATTFTMKPSASAGTLSIEGASGAREGQAPQSMEGVPGTEP